MLGLNGDYVVILAIMVHFKMVISATQQLDFISRSLSVYSEWV